MAISTHAAEAGYAVLERYPNIVLGSLVNNEKEHKRVRCPAAGQQCPTHAAR